jgi:hypothetical protein
MSSLLDRYVYAVERRLPQAQRADIGAELRETIQSRIDEEAASKGRGLTDAELSDILKSVGRPIVVASRYGTTQYLIGPSLYPYYVSTLKTVAVVALPILIISVVVRALGSDTPVLAALGVLGRAMNTALVAFGIVTVIFWQMGRPAARPDFDHEWDPADLPEPPATEPQTVPRTASIGHAVCLAIYLLWWVGVLPLPQLVRLWTERYTPQLAPVWLDVSLAVTLLFAFQLVLHLLAVWRPLVPRWRLVLHMAGNVLALGIISYLVQADSLILKPAGSDWAAGLDSINDAARLGLIVLAVLIVLGLVFGQGRRLLGFQPLSAADPAFAARVGRKANQAALHASRFGGGPSRWIRPRRP